jgi:hypothetical protein
MKFFFTINKQLTLIVLLLMLGSPLWATICGNATNIPSIPVLGQALVCEATNDLNSTTVPASCGAVSNSYKGGMEALYTFTPTITQGYIISINGVSWTSIFVYQGCPSSGGTCVNSIGNSATTKSIDVNLTAGLTYFIWFDTWPSPDSPCPGTFSIDAAPPPPANDLCSGAIPISCGQTVMGSTIPATYDSAPTCTTSEGTGGGVWYAFTGTGGTITASLCGSAYDSKIRIYTGTCAVLSCVVGNDDFCGLQSQASFLSSAGTNYLILVHGFSTNSGLFTLAVTCTSPPCGAPASLTSSNISTNSATISWGTVSGATQYNYSVGPNPHTCGTGGINTAGTSINLTSLIPNTTYTYCVRTDACGGGSASTYSSASFTTAPLPNDACAGAITVACSSTVSGSTVGAASDAALGSCGIGSGGTPGNGVWYKLVGNGAQVTLNLCASAYDTKVHVYTGTCAGLTCLVSNDDNAAACGGGSTRSQAIFNANVGTDYYILVNGSGSTTGTFSMNISCLCGPSLGAPWTTTNIGSSNGGAIENVCDNTIDVSATNYGSPTNDIQSYAWQQMCGNGFIKAKVENVTNGGWGGIMFRENNAGGSKKIALRTQLTSTVLRDLRAATNGVMNQQQFPRPNTPQWLRLTRTGNVFVGETSLDGVNWDFTFTATLVLPSCIEVGLFAQSINASTTTTAIFSNLMGVPLTPPVIPLTGGNTTNINDVEHDFIVCPNPAQSEINVKMGNEFIGKNVTIRVSNQLGQTVITHRITEVQSQIERLPLNNLSGGLYILSIQTEGQELISKKFVVGQNRS